MKFLQSLLKLPLYLLKAIWSFTRTALTTLLWLIRRAIFGFWHWIESIAGGIKGLWLSLGPRWLRGILVASGILIAGYYGILSFVNPNLTLERIDQVHYLNEGWDSQTRELYYYTPQGTELLGLPYDWFVNLELPLSTDRLASEDNMRGWGFIVEPGQLRSDKNPGNLPVGLSRHIDPKTGLERLDMGCAMCHTGELHYKGTALRIDGGQAVQSISTIKRGEFMTTLAIAALETRINPSKWDRFADRVVGQDRLERSKLKGDLSHFLGKLRKFAQGPGALKLYPTEEGRGRTDAVGRIANVLFGYDLDVPENYRVADAPVSYPFLWDIWRFDWVQYTGFTNQPMARNIGESLGVMAPIKLVDDKGKLLGPGEFGETVIDLDGMHCTETILRKLKPPKWPEAILGSIDIEKATAGKHLFAEQCAYCHGPHISEPYAWPVADGPNSNPAQQNDVNWKEDMAGQITKQGGVSYRKDWRETIWAIPRLDVDVVGTDPTAADNYINNKYDASKIIPGSPPVNAGNGLQIVLNRLIPILYSDWKIKGPAIADYDGLNIPFRISNQRAYKSRPLHGVWATPPFLHNGSVPTLYDLLSPLRARPVTFAIGNREYDPLKLGYETVASAGSFVHDTSKKGNSNQGHLFTDVDMPGRIGELLTEQERMQLLEYIKVMGNPDFSIALGGDPLNWDRYSQPSEDKSGLAACVANPVIHGHSSGTTGGEGL